MSMGRKRGTLAAIELSIFAYSRSKRRFVDQEGMSDGHRIAEQADAPNSH